MREQMDTRRTDEETSKYFSYAKARRVFGSARVKEVRKVLEVAARQVPESVREVLVDDVRPGLVVTWRWAR